MLIEQRDKPLDLEAGLDRDSKTLTQEQVERTFASNFHLDRRNILFRGQKYGCPSVIGPLTFSWWLDGYPVPRWGVLSCS